VIDVYQQETHLVDEVFFSADEPNAIDALLARASGPEGYFAAIGTHYDYHNAFDGMLIAAARKWGVPLVSTKQMLEWMDGRARSEIRDLSWSGGTLSFRLSADERTHGMLMAELPLVSELGTLHAISRDGRDVAFTVETIKGLRYALFPGATGYYEARYRSTGAEETQQPRG
jgi:hypothetical protein